MNDIGPGDLVRCVDDSPYGGGGNGFGYWDYPVRRGVIYTVREINCTHPTWPKIPCLRLIEVVCKYDDPLAICRFAPVRDDDIAVFRQICLDVQAEKKEPVNA